MTAAAAAPPRAEYKQAIAISDIRPSPFNHRKTFTGLDELAESIRTKGLINPITVRLTPTNGKKPSKELYELVAGERRWRAAEMAGLAFVPGFVRELSDVEVLELQLIENVQRADVHPLEEADGYRELLDKHGYTVDRIAEKTGKSKAYVYARLKLCSLAAGARKAFLDGGLNPSLALAVARIPVPKLQEQAVKELLGRGEWDAYEDADIQRGAIEDPATRDEKYEPLSVRQGMQLLQRRYMLRLELAKFDTADATLTKAGACTTCPHRSGNQAELFADVKSADVCTNPPCFEEKTKAGFARAASAAKKEGVQVLADKADKIFDEDYNGKQTLSYTARAKYFEPDEEIPYGILPASGKQPTWKKQLGTELGNVPKVLAQDGEGAARVLYDREAAIALLRKNGKIPTKKEASASSSGSNSYAKEQAARRRALEARRAVVKLGLVELREKGAKAFVAGDGKNAVAWWRWLARGILTSLHVDDQALLCAALALEVPKTPGSRSGQEKVLGKLIDEADVVALRGIIVQLLAAAAAAGGYYSTSLGEDFTGACRQFGVDVKKLQATVAAAAKEKKAAKAGKKARRGK